MIFSLIIKNNQQVDFYISQLILNTDLKGINRQRNIPDELDRLGLFVSSGCLKYALGYIEDFEREYEVTADKDHNASFVMVIFYALTIKSCIKVTYLLQEIIMIFIGSNFVLTFKIFNIT